MFESLKQLTFADRARMAIKVGTPILGTGLALVGPNSVDVEPQSVPTEASQPGHEVRYNSQHPFQTLALSLDFNEVNAQATKPPCIVRAHFRAQYFVDKGGETYPDGKPKYQEGVDEKLRVAAGREILATSGEISKKLTTDGAGIAFGTANGKPVDYAEFPCAKDSQATTVNWQDLGNGDKGKREIPNGQQKTIDDMVATNNSTVDEAKKGPTFMPFTKEVPRTPGVPANATPGAKIDTTKSSAPVTGGNEGGNNSSSVKNPISIAADAIFNFPKDNPELTKIIVVATVLGAYVLWRRRPGFTRRYIPRTRIPYA